MAKISRQWTKHLIRLL